MSKAMKGIGVIQKLNKTLPRHSLITIYKSFVRPHLGYGDIIYDHRNNESSAQKLEEFNTKLALQLQVPSKEHLRVSCTANKVLNI